MYNVHKVTMTISPEPRNSILSRTSYDNEDLVKIQNEQLIQEYNQLLEHIKEKIDCPIGYRLCIYPNRTKYTINRGSGHFKNRGGTTRYIMKDKFPILHHFDMLLQMYDLDHVLIYIDGFVLYGGWQKGWESKEYYFDTD